MLAKPIHLADQVAKQAGWQCLRTECTELRSRAERLATLLRQAARVPDLYERPASRVMADTVQALTKAAAAAGRCFQSHSRLRRFFTLNPASGIPRTLALLDTALVDVAWLIRISSPPNPDDDDDDNDGLLHGLPNIAQNEPMLGMVWDHVARLQTGAHSARAESAATLASLARDSPHFAKYIIEEDGVPPLVRLLKEGGDDARGHAAAALGLLGRDEESAGRLLQSGAAVRHLVGHLASGIINEHARYSVAHAATTTTNGGSRSAATPSPPQPMTSLHSVVLAKSHSVRQGESGSSIHVQHQARKSQMQSVVHSAIAANSTTANGAATPPPTARSSQKQLRPNGSSGRGPRGGGEEDPAAKAEMKAMAAKALWKLARGHVGVCTTITESRALLCFARILEDDDDAGTSLRFYSAMAVMEIARVAEHNLALRQSAFKPSSPAAKAVVDQLLRAVRDAVDDGGDLLRPCVTALGCLSRTFTASETRVVGPLVQLLDEHEATVTREAVVALTKFACTENHLHVNHCKAVVDAGGARHLVQLVYLGDQVQVEALILLCYVALHVPESEEVAQAGVLAVLLWASKQAHMVQDTRVEALLPDARARLELFQSRASR
ncbi:hypothetical protein PR202_ga26416 [Eleusine coracana subsp. coracana]|uniref:DUF7792 domain-containing protein n=1 Tax=Eleusine coracana subsp. coracana TaxID=191504 RepID=A0AAV5DE32_ELECO|nr:hypothetical protein PR202_ga26416 [Eleusine coracana subsp. coracana]